MKAWVQPRGAGPVRVDWRAAVRELLAEARGSALVRAAVGMAREERRALVDGFWPRACRVCGDAAEDGVACAEHGFARERRRVICGLCSRALPRAVATEVRDPEPPWRGSRVAKRRAAWRRCRECREAAPGYGRLVCLGDYEAGLRAWVLAFKNGKRSLAEPLARMLGERLARAGWTARGRVEVVLVPVPSHPWRVFERGADGPDALARALGAELGWPVRRLLVRRRFTRPQGAPGSVSRAENVRGALQVRPRGLSRGWRARGERERAFVLVDDVVTSGATLVEAARVLRSASASGGRRALVGAVSLARAQWGRGSR